MPRDLPSPIFARVLGPAAPDDPRNPPVGSVYFQPVVNVAHSDGPVTFLPVWTDIRPEPIPGDPSGREWPPIAVPFLPDAGPAYGMPAAGQNLVLHGMGGDWRYYVPDVADAPAGPSAGSWRDRPSML